MIIDRITKIVIPAPREKNDVYVPILALHAIWFTHVLLFKMILKKKTEKCFIKQYWNYFSLFNTVVLNEFLYFSTIFVLIEFINKLLQIIKFNLSLVISKF